MNPTKREEEDTMAKRYGYKVNEGKIEAIESLGLRNEVEIDTAYKTFRKKGEWFSAIEAEAKGLGITRFSGKYEAEAGTIRILGAGGDGGFPEGYGEAYPEAKLAYYECSMKRAEKMAE